MTSSSDKIVTFADAGHVAARHRRENRRIVFTAYGDTHRNIANGLFRFDPATKTVVPRHMVDRWPDRPAEKIVPSLARNLQLYGLLYGMAFLTSPFDDTLDFGLTSDRDVVPDLDVLAEGIEKASEHLAAATAASR